MKQQVQVTISYKEVSWAVPKTTVLNLRKKKTIKNSFDVCSTIRKSRANKRNPDNCVGKPFSYVVTEKLREKADLFETFSAAA